MSGQADFLLASLQNSFLIFFNILIALNIFQQNQCENELAFYNLKLKLKLLLQLHAVISERVCYIFMCNKGALLYLSR